MCPSGLTTTKAPFIEDARAHGEIYIRQPYELYSDENQETWGRLLSRMTPRWSRYANLRYLEGLDRLHLSPARIPRLEDLTRFMAPLTGFRSRAVSGYVPSYLFFDCLRRREFPTTITIRDGAQLEYLPEPDIFHDVAGHVPMHTDPAFAEALVRFGEAAAAAAERARGDRRHPRTAARPDQQDPRHVALLLVQRRIRADARSQQRPQGLRQRPALLVRRDRARHRCPRGAARPFSIEEVINQPFEIDHYQPLLYVVDSFDHLFELVSELERWIRDGKLDDVAPGEPAVSETDLQSFLSGGT